MYVFVIGRVRPCSHLFIRIEAPKIQLNQGDVFTLRNGFSG